MSNSAWFRIDKTDGSIAPTNGVAVLRAASGYYERPSDVIATGRFWTPFAIYSRADKLEASEAQPCR